MRPLLTLLFALVLTYPLASCQESPVSPARSTDGLVLSAGETGQITAPHADAFVSSMLHLEATYDSDTNDGVQWAVRSGTCARGTNTVAGNVDGYDTSYSWDSSNFEATIDVSPWDPGMYCFVFNPQDDSSDGDLRLTRQFHVVSGLVNGGGHLLEDDGGNKRKDWWDVSFGGGLACVGELNGFSCSTGDIIGEWQVVLHNVPDYTDSQFHTTGVTELNFFTSTNTDPSDPDACIAAANFTADGTFDGTPGYSMIFRAGDSDDAASESTDTVRIELYDPSDQKLFDTSLSGIFPNASDCVGSNRTALDTGNLTISF